MGKKSSTSWFSVVKRAFRSPTKEENHTSCRRKDHEQEEEEEKKREKRSWLFRKLNSSNNNSNHVQICETKTTPNNGSSDPISDVEQQIAIAATTAQAAVEIVRLTRPTNFVRRHQAAILIQTAFRGYLARRAHRALKGLVKLQAVVRGQNVRKQTKLTLKCMQALVRVQDRVRDQRARLSHEGSRRSMFDESNHSGILDSTYLQHERRSLSRDLSSILNDWDNRRYATEEIEAMVESKKEAALKREKALAYAFSSQIWRSQRSPSIGDEKEMEGGPKWLDRWMATKQWESNSNCRASTDRKEAIKTVEIDTSRPYSCTPISAGRSSQSQIHQQRQNIPKPHYYNLLTPSPSRKTKPLQVRSASPRCLKEDKSYSVAHTPSLGSRYRYAMCASRSSAIPNYMAATESAKARVRSQSAPKQRPSPLEREQRGGGSSAKRHLSYPAPEPQYYSSFSQNLRSPSFKSVQAAHFGMERKSNYSSCYSESIIGGEISPCSTTDLRRLK